MAEVTNSTPLKVVKPKASRDDWTMRAFMVMIGAYLLIALAFPLYTMLSKSFENKDGVFIGVENYIKYFSTPALFNSIENSVTISIITMVITVTLAFIYAYALTRSCMRFKGFFKIMAMIPILVPSLLPGIGLIYMFGKQGYMKWLLFGETIYGPLGIVIAEVFFTFPHALLIIMTALSISDARLYEAATVLRAPKWKIFWTVTLPSARYGLISAAFVVFTLVITDFGVPKVIGGQYNVLAVDIYKQIIGQQNFSMGAVVSVVLLIPAIFAFFIDRQVQKKQVAQLSARAVPFEPKPDKKFDTLMMSYSGFIVLIIVTILATCQFAALVKFWPYNLSLGLQHYNFDLMDGGGWDSYYNSIRWLFGQRLLGRQLCSPGPTWWKRDVVSNKEERCFNSWR